MKAELHKVTFQLHGVLRDDDGKVTDELHVSGGAVIGPDGKPTGERFEFKLWGHELERLPAEVKQILARFEAQAQAQAQVPPANANRAQRRANSKRPAAAKRQPRSET